MVFAKKELTYSFIVSDFDRTLVCYDGSISAENKKAIREYCKNGGKFAISSGRMHYGLLPRVKELGLDGLVSCGHGALIIDAKTDKVVFSKTIPYEITAQICEKMEDLDLPFNVYGQNAYYANRSSERLTRYEEEIKCKAILVTDKPLSQFVRDNKICAYHVLSFVNASDNARILETMYKCSFEGCKVTKSAEDIVEILNSSCNKGVALEFMANYYGIPLERVIAVGDQWNDLSMIEKAGLGVAVKNANEKVKERSDVVLEFTNEQSAISELIERYAYRDKK